MGTTNDQQLKRWIGTGKMRLLFDRKKETEEEVLENFRSLVDSNVFPEDDFLLFKVQLKHHKRKGEREQIYIACRDSDTFDSVKEFVVC